LYHGGTVLLRHASPVVLSRTLVVLELLVGGCRRLFCLILVLEQERKLLKRAAGSLGPQEVDDGDFETQEDDVGQQVLPLRVLHADRVDECVEEVGSASEELEESDTTSTRGERVQFYERQISNFV